MKQKRPINDYYIDKARELRSRGLVDAEIYKSLGIGKTRFYEWKRESDDFSTALEEGKQLCISGVMNNSLAKKASGFTKKVTKINYKFDHDRYNRDLDASEEMEVEKPDQSKYWIPDYMTVEEKFFPPDTRAIERLLQINEPKIFEIENDGASDELVINLELNPTPKSAEKSEYTDEINRILNGED